MRADNVVNATGVWADQLRPEELHDEAEVPTIRPSRGTHITLSTDDLPLVGGAIVPAGGGRSIFALPWLGRTLIGTTDNDYDESLPLEHVAPSDEDIDYLLAATNEYFATDLARADLTGAYAGVRPLISTGDPKKSVDISRKAELYETSSGMITITGGKLTTWRRMAKMAVDRLVEREARDAPCRTHEIPLGQPVDPAELPRLEPVAEIAYQRLAARYGHAAHDVLAVARERGELAQPIVEGLPDLLAEVAFAARREQALTLADVLLRRTRLGLLAGRELGDQGTLERVAAALGAELAWDEARQATRCSGFATRPLPRGSHRNFSAADRFRPAARSPHQEFPPSMPRLTAIAIVYRSAALAALVALLALLAPAGARAGFFGGDMIDGPDLGIVRLGDLDLARDGTGAVVYVKRDGVVEHVYISRLVDGLWSPPERLDSGFRGPSADPVVAAADGGRLAVAYANGGQLLTMLRPAAAANWGPTVAVGGGRPDPLDRHVDQRRGVRRVEHRLRRARRPPGAQRAVRSSRSTAPLDVDPGPVGRRRERPPAGGGLGRRHRGGDVGRGRPRVRAAAVRAAPVRARRRT